jgi:3-dehydroquinate synthase
MIIHSTVVSQQDCAIHLCNSLDRCLHYHLQQFTHVIAIFDRNTAIFIDQISALLRTIGLRYDCITLPSVGETNKSLTHYRFLVQRALRLNFLRRQSCFLAVGGGTVIDLVGFVAATYQRGVSYINLPTTLLAMVDAAIGGKVGINLGGGKHLLGAFHQPHAVLIDTTKLASLPERSLRAGFAEAIKAALVARSSTFFALLERFASRRDDPRLLRRLIAQSIRTKLYYVERDWREENLDRLLNLGHEVAHALEASTHFDDRVLMHGEAVALGILTAASISKARGLLTVQSLNRLTRLLSSLSCLPASPPGVVPKRLARHLHVVAGIRDGNLRVVLPMDPLGRATIVHDISSSEVIRTLSAILG